MINSRSKKEKTTFSKGPLKTFPKPPLDPPNPLHDVPDPTGRPKENPKDPLRTPHMVDCMRKLPYHSGYVLAGGAAHPPPPDFPHATW